MDLLGFTIVIPLLPFWTLSLGAPEYIFGLFLAIYSFFQFIFSPIWGRLSDKFGRRPIILSGLTGTLISFIILLAAATLFNSLEMILLSRIIGGIFTAATLPTSYAYISDSVKAEEQTKSYGMIGASMGLAYVLGPAIGGLLTTFGKFLITDSTGYWAPISLAVILSIFNLVYGIYKLPESLSIEIKLSIVSKKSIKKQKFEIISILKQNPKILILILLFTIANYAFSSLDAILAIFGKVKFGMDELLTGLVFMSAGIVMVLTQGLLVGRLSKRFNRTNLIISGFIFMTVAFFMITFTNSFEFLFILTIPVCFGLSIAQPSGNSLLSMEMPPDKRGEILGINESFKSGSRIVGPLIASFLIGIDLFIPWYFTSFIVFLGVILAIMLNISFKKSGTSNISKSKNVLSL
jgi:MFS family permease